MAGTAVRLLASPRHTPCSRVAAVLTVALAATVGAVHPSRAALTSWVGVLVGAVVVVGTLGGAKLWRDNCFESRLVVVVLAIGTATCQTLASTVGAPGGHAAHWRATALLVVALSVAIPLLVLGDTRLRARVRKGQPPYAL